MLVVSVGFGCSSSRSICVFSFVLSSPVPFWFLCASSLLSILFVFCCLIAWLDLFAFSAVYIMLLISSQLSANTFQNYLICPSYSVDFHASIITARLLVFNIVSCRLTFWSNRRLVVFLPITVTLHTHMNATVCWFAVASCHIPSHPVASHYLTASLASFALFVALRSIYVLHTLFCLSLFS